MPTMVSELTGMKIAATRGVSAPAKRQPEADGVVENRDDEARDDHLAGPSGVSEECRKRRETAAADHRVAGRRQARGLIGHRDANVCRGERSGIVQPVADHQHMTAVRSGVGDERELVLR